MSYAIAFASGAALDFLYVAWVGGIQKSKYLQPAVASMAIGACGLVGLGQSFAGGFRPVAALSYILGLGAGTIAGVWYGRRREA